MNYELQDSNPFLPDINNKSIDHDYYTNQILNPIDLNDSKQGT